MRVHLHHIGLPCSDLERSRRFYSEIVGLEEVVRPSLPVAGAWFRLGDGQELHLILADAHATLRGRKGLDFNDVHFAVRIDDCAQMAKVLRSHGYSEDAAIDDPMAMRMLHRIGFPQIYIVDPDRNLIEFNAKGAA